MEYMLVLMGVIAIALIILVLKLVKRALKLFFIALILILLSTAVFGYFFVNDVRDISQDFSEGNIMVLFTDDDKIVTGLTMMNNETVVYGTQEIQEFEMHYLSGEYDNIVGEGERVLLMEIVTVDEKNESNLIFNFLQERVPALNLSKRVTDKVQDEEAARIILDMIEGIKEDPTYVFRAYKEDKLIVYPKTLVFKTIKYFMRRDS